MMSYVELKLAISLRFQPSMSQADVVVSTVASSVHSTSCEILTARLCAEQAVHYM